LAVEENALAVLAHVITDAYQFRGSKPRRERSTTRKAHQATVAEARAWLATNYAHSATLQQIAHQLDVSPYHLCRVFRQQTGLSVHRYRTQLRLRMALDALEAGATDLTRLALDHGFSSHSHFSHVFQDTFGISPSAIRGSLRGGQFRQMSKNLIATSDKKSRMS
jgi:transcriptional regulator GlxA family with amidase domain